MRPCAEIRPILRDYSDGELTPEEKGEVDDHVHGCSVCGRLLMEAELEVIRLKQAITFVEPPPDFTRIVVQRARAELASEDPDAVAAPEGFTANVMKQVFAEALRDKARNDASPEPEVRRVPGAFGQVGRFVRHPAVFMPLAAAAVLLVAWRFLLGTARPDGLRLEAGTAAAVAPAGGSGLSLQPGQVLPGGQQVRVADGATALLSGTGAFESIRRLEVRGPARFALALLGEEKGAAPARLLVFEGGVRLSAAKEVALVTPIPAEVRLTPARGGEDEDATGELDLSLREITRHDESLAGGRAFQSMRVRVFAGEALLRRGAAAPETIAALEVAVLDPWSALHREKAVETAWLATISLGSGRNLAADALAASEKRIQGKVVRSSDRQPLDGATVTLHLGDARHSARTQPDGFFQLAAPAQQWQGATPFLAVQVPERSRATDLACHLVEEPPDAAVRFIGDVAVPEPWTARGRVSLADGSPAEGVKVRVFQYDEVFGRSREFESLANVTNSAGKFELADLPAAAEPGVGIVLLLDHHAYPLTARFDLFDVPASERGWVELSLPESRTALVRPAATETATALVVVDEPDGIASSWCSRFRDFRLERGVALGIPGWTESSRLFADRQGTLVQRALIAVPGEDGLTLAAAGEVLDGRVLDSAGYPVPAVPVLVGGLGSALRAECLTDQSGEFRLEGSFGGSLFLEVGWQNGVVRVPLADSARRNLEVRHEVSGSRSGLAPKIQVSRLRSIKKGWTRYGVQGTQPATGVTSLRVAVADGSGSPVGDAAVFFHVPGSDHAVFLGRSPLAARSLPRVPGRLLAFHATRGIGHRTVDLANLPAAGEAVEVLLREPVTVAGTVAPSLGSRIGPVTFRCLLEEGWEVALSRHPDAAGHFGVSVVPVPDNSAPLRVACGSVICAAAPQPGSQCKVTIAGTRDALEVKATVQQP